MRRRTIRRRQARIYTETTGRLTLTAGQTVRTISVPTLDDSEQESDERFTVTLSNPSGAMLNDDMGEGTITDNDGGPTMPELSIGNALVREGETARFEVRLSPAATDTVTVGPMPRRTTRRRRVRITRKRGGR